MAAFADRMENTDLVSDAPAAESTSAVEAPVVTEAASNATADAQPATDAPVTNTATEAQPVTSKPKTWKERYGSEEAADREAFALEQRAAAMAAELKELKANRTATPPAVETQPAHPAPVEAPTHPDLAKLDTSLREIQSDRADLKVKADKLVERLKEVEKDIEGAATIVFSDDADFDMVQKAKRDRLRAEGEKARILAEHRGLVMEDSVLLNRGLVLNLHRSSAEQRIQVETTRAAEAQAREVAEAKTFVDTYKVSIQTAISKGTIPEKFHQRFTKWAENALMALPPAQINSFKADAIPKFIEGVETDFMDFYKESHTVQSAEYGARKKKDAEVAAPDGDKAVATVVKSSGFKSRREVDEHLAALMRA